MSSALTFYFKEIFPDYIEFKRYLSEYLIFDTTNPLDDNFAQQVFKIVFRRYCNSNIQYDTKDDFKNDFANILEDHMMKYKKQLSLIEKMQNITDDEIQRLSEAVANTTLNPNTKVDDPSKVLDYISSQASTFAKDNKMQAFLRAIAMMPSKYIYEITDRCRKLFKTIIPNQNFTFEGREIYEDREN